MQVHRLHPWDLDPAAAVEVQQRLRGRVMVGSLERAVEAVAGVDVGVRQEWVAAGTLKGAAP